MNGKLIGIGLVIGAVFIIVAAILASEGQQKVAAKGTKTPAIPVPDTCKVPRVSLPTPTSAVVDNRTLARLVGYYSCTKDTHLPPFGKMFEVGFAVYDGKRTKPALLCPTELYEGLYVLEVGTCKTIGSPVRIPIPTPNP